MVIKATFKDRLFEKSAVLINVISEDNYKQQDANGIAAFIEAVNRLENKSNIKQVIFVDTRYLNRHYDFKYVSSSEKDSWKNKKGMSDALKKLDEYKISYEVIDWKQIANANGFDEIKKKVIADYWGDDKLDNLDEKFRSICLNVAEEFKHKGTKKAIINVLLEEVAGAILLAKQYDKPIITYPGKLNDAIKYGLNKYHGQVNYNEYKVKGLSENNTKDNPRVAKSYQARPESSASFALGDTLAYFAIKFTQDDKGKREFLAAYLKFCGNYEESLAKSLPFFKDMSSTQERDGQISAASLEDETPNRRAAENEQGFSRSH